MLVESFDVVSPNVEYTPDSIKSSYRYDSTKLTRRSDGGFVVEPIASTVEFCVDRRVPKLG